MANEPNPSFSAKAGGMQPAGWYTYPVGYGGSTKDNPVSVYIPYPFVPGTTPIDDNPGDISDK